MSANSITKSYGVRLFGDAVMREKLTSRAYQILQNTIQSGAELDPSVADVIANAMKEWAIEQGATHYAHWFQPLTGVTAEKHTSFIEMRDNHVVTRLSGKNLIKGEPDASAFPSGGLRATFEARGYTAWDCTSPAFLKEEAGGLTLCIPTAFCSYNGEAMDQKTPLLRSMEALNKHALRVLRLFGDNETKRVVPFIGAEQEYFLVDQSFLDQRLDLKLTGKALFGLPTLKSQAESRHYYGSPSDRVSTFMRELDLELWKLGIPSKISHNEAAPCQHELVPLHTTVNIACDQNQLIMESMRKIARRLGLACLLSEKPFPRINGSGKHNNWSLGTDTGYNLFEPGKTPYNNAQFLIFLSAVIRAVDKYAPLLRLSCASASNDRRLGGYEAPPVIISIYLGNDIMAVIEQVKTNQDPPERDETLNFGVPSMPEVYRDSTDRNRTSPFAFTGNKFEFRMPGASQSISECNTILNTIVAESLDLIATRLESSTDFATEVRQIFRDIFVRHERILFVGDGYSEEWFAEAARRNLPVLGDTVDVLPYMICDNAIDLFAKYGVFSESELRARHKVMTRTYVDQLTLDARVVVDMVGRQIVPAVVQHIGDLSKTAIDLQTLSVPSQVLIDEISHLTHLVSNTRNLLAALQDTLSQALPTDDQLRAEAVRDNLLPRTYALCNACNALEALLPRNAWPMPTLDEILYKDIQL